MIKRLVTLLLAVCMLACGFSACDPHEPTSADAIDIPGPGETEASEAPSPGDPTQEASAESGVLISELMADNADFIMGCMDDWAELYNPSDSEVRLDGYTLAKKEAGSGVYSLEGLSIPAKGYLVVRFTEDAPFRLSKDGDALVLSRNGVQADELEFDGTLGSASYSHDGVCAFATPGFPNTEEGYGAYLEALELPGVRINEVVSSNTRWAPVDGEYYDFVEIFNGTDRAVDLSGYYLSDKKKEPQRYRFPQVSLEPGGFFIVYCSGLTGGNHAPFKISSSGETLYLSDGEGFADCVRVPADLNRDESYGRQGKRFVYFTEVTPGAPNGTGHESSPGAPTASVPSGAYFGEQITVELEANGEIHYTLDGTRPTANSKLYTGPITVKHLASIRAVSVIDGRESEPVSFFYLVNIEHAYPVLNVAISQDHLTGSEGVLNHVDPEYEHEAYVTMMDQGEECFSAPCGFKLHGNDSKKGAKQNFQLRFREQYGMSKLEYKLFDNRDIEVFNSLVLKGGSEDYAFCCFRDELCTGLVDGTTELSTQAYRPVILYLNGEYWGIYWLRERFDAEYCAQRLGVSDGSVNLLKDYGGALVKGSGKTFYDLIEYCRTHDLSNKSDYEHVLSQIDYMSMIDWYVCRSYMGDSDLANQRFYSSSEADGKWHWCFFDLDWALWKDTEDPIGNTARADGNHVIFRALLKNSEFKDMFLKRYAKLMKTVLNERTILNRIDEFVELMQPEIEADRAKYGITMREWEFYVEQLKSYVRDGKRNKTVLKGIKNYFGLSDAQMESYFG